MFKDQLYDFPCLELDVLGIQDGTYCPEMTPDWEQTLIGNKPNGGSAISQTTLNKYNDYD